MKPILQSRTFWLNVLGVALTVGQVLPPKYAGPVLAALSVVLFGGAVLRISECGSSPPVR